MLVISGPCGAGKSTVGFECLELLEAGGVAAAMIDAELAYFHPKPDDDPQGTRVAEQALAAVAPVYAAAGIERLLLPRVIERPRHLDIVRAAVPGSRFQIAWLDVPAETVAERLAAREVGSALDWHLQRAEEIRSNALAHDLFDFIIDGDRTVREVAQDVLGARRVARAIVSRYAGEWTRSRRVLSEASLLDPRTTAISSPPVFVRHSERRSCVSRCGSTICRWLRRSWSA